MSAPEWNGHEIAGSYYFLRDPEVGLPLLEVLFIHPPHTELILLEDELPEDFTDEELDDELDDHSNQLELLDDFGVDTLVELLEVDLLGVSL